MLRLQNTWKIAHTNVMVFYNVFVAFVGLNNNTILAMQNIEFGSVSSDRYWSSRKAQYRSDTDPEYRIGAPLVCMLVI